MGSEISRSEVTRTQSYIHAPPYIRVSYTYRYICKYIYIYILIPICPYTSLYVYVDVDIHTHNHTHTYIYIYTYTHSITYTHEEHCMIYPNHMTLSMISFKACIFPTYRYISLHLLPLTIPHSEPGWWHCAPCPTGPGRRTALFFPTPSNHQPFLAHCDLVTGTTRSQPCHLCPLRLRFLALALSPVEASWEAANHGKSR